jgi:hypothetical protein
MTYPVLPAGSSGYTIERSVRLKAGSSATFTRTPASAGNRQIFTISFWFKRGLISTLDLFTGNNANGFICAFRPDNTLYLYDFGAGTSGFQIWSARVFRDPSAWYHLVIAVDTTQATDSNRIKVYINGVQENLATWNVGAGASRYPSLNANFDWNNTNQHKIGYANTYAYYDGYLAEFNNVSGLQLNATSFGEYNPITGVWQPKGYSGAYGTNGFYLKFTDNSAATAAALGKDYSGNGNNWTPNNILVTGRQNDSMTDVPTLSSPTSANFAVMNPLATSTFVASSSPPGSGNLVIYQATTSQWAEVIGTIGVSSGKWYWEIFAENITTNSYLLLGVCSEAEFGTLTSTNKYVGLTASSWGYYAQTGQKYNNNVAAAYGAAYATNDVIGVALDMDAGTLTFYKNNVSQGVAYSGFTGVIYPAFSSMSGVGTVNFGQQPFVYTPPTGHLRLNTFNIPKPSIPNGANQFGATPYTGTGATLSVTNNLLNASFQPDFVWIKSRSAATSHSLYDSVRGTTRQLVITTAAETTQATGLTAFNSNGFTVGALANVNTSAATYVAWNWKAGGTAVTNTAGSITSQVSANPSAGFSIVTWTSPASGAYTVGHGLGVAPSMIIMKERTNSGTSFITYHKSISTTTALYLVLNTTASTSTFAGIWGSALPTSTVFGNTSGSGVFVNSAVVAYCFSEIAGYSKFGSYTGNANANGPFIPTNFRPRFVMIKEATAARGWIMFDTLRNPANVVDNYIFAEVANAAASLNLIDILSNGFKIRSTNLNVNDTTSNTFIYMAFAENPFQNALAR